MQARVPRYLLIGAAAALGLFGAVSFVVPDWASANFPWKVGPFMAMTIGGWALGTAGIALDAARDFRPARAYPLVLFVSLFGVLELAVVLVFFDRLATTAALTLPYLLGLFALAAGGVATAAAWRGQRIEVLGPGRVPTWMKTSTLLFGAVVAALAIGTTIAGASGVVARGDVFPEPLSLFSIRAFSAFFAAISVTSLSLVAARLLLPFDALARAGLYLIVPITIAALVNLWRFDFVGRPGSFVYLAAYVVVGAILAARVWWTRRSLAPLSSEQMASAN